MDKIYQKCVYKAAVIIWYHYQLKLTNYDKELTDFYRSQHFFFRIPPHLENRYRYKIYKHNKVTRKAISMIKHLKPQIEKNNNNNLR